jgi:hypothetical protein
MEMLDNIKFDEISAKLGKSIVDALQKITEFITDIDWTDVGSKIADFINNIPLADIISSALALAGSIWNAIADALMTIGQDSTNGRDIGKNIADNFNAILENVNFAEMAIGLSTIANNIIQGILGFLENANTDEINQSIADFFNNLDIDIEKLTSEIIQFIDKLDLSPVFEFVGKLMMSGLMIGIELKKKEISSKISEIVGSIASIFGTTVDKVKKVGKDIIAGLINGITSSNPIKIITNFINTIIQLWKDLFDVNSPSRVMQEIGGYIVDGFILPITNFFAGVRDWLKTNVVDKFLSNIKALFGITGDTQSDEMSTVGTSVKDGFIAPILEFFDNIKDWIKEHITDPFKNSICEFFGITEGSDSDEMSTIGTSIKDGFIAPIVDFFDNVKNWVSEHITTPFIDSVKSLFGIDGENSSVFSGIGGKIMNGLADGLRGGLKFVQDICNNLISGIEKLINKIIDGINSMFGVLNKVKIDIPDNIPVVGGMNIGFNYKNLDSITLGRVSIPGLAKGTVIPPTMNEFIARLGDNSTETEVVSPLSTMKQAFLEALDEANFGSNVNVYLEGDAGQVFKLVRTENTKWKKQHNGVGAF